MTILTLLEEHLGQHIQQRDEYLFRCPFCHHHKKKLSINIINNKWKCWICDAKGARIISLLKRMNLPTKVINKFKEVMGDDVRTNYIAEETQQTLVLPAEYKPLWKPQKSYPYLHALTYLKHRNITTDDILRYRMGYCETGTYAGRIIVPSYDSNNQLNYFTARSFYEGSMKYKNPPTSKNTIIFENMIDWDEPIILCEGMFDAIAIKRNAIPLLGKNIQSNLMKRIVTSVVDKIYIALDRDAIKQALRFCEMLLAENKEVYLVDLQDKDPSEMGFKNFTKLIQKTVPLTYYDLMEQKLAI